MSACEKERDLVEIVGFLVSAAAKLVVGDAPATFSGRDVVFWLRQGTSYHLVALVCLLVLCGVFSPVVVMGAMLRRVRPAIVVVAGAGEVYWPVRSSGPATLVPPAKPTASSSGRQGRFWRALRRSPSSAALLRPQCRRGRSYATWLSSCLRGSEVADCVAKNIPFPYSAFS